MKSVVFDGKLRIARRERPASADGEVLVKLRLAGICNTDLELMQGYKGFSGTLGHEFVGKVIEGPTGLYQKRLVGEINIACGTCDMCRRGMPTHCRQRRVLGIQDYGGAFAEYFILPEENVHVVPDSVPDEVAVFTEPLAAAGQVLEMEHLRPHDRVIVIGAGKLGMLVAQVLRLTGVDLAVIVRRDRQAALLAEWGIAAVRREELADQQADAVVDCTGNADGFAAALGLVRPRGTIVLKSTYAGLPQADLARIAVNEIRVVGSRCGPFDAALRLLEQGLVDPRPLIDACYPLREADNALNYAAQPGVLKVLLEP